MKKNTTIVQSNKLIFLGLILFTLGVVVGLFIQNMSNPRMALSAHLEGILNGIFLIILGLIWTKLVLSEKISKITFYLAVYATFANLIATILAAITGFGKMMPIAGGREGTGIIELLISVLLVSLSICILAVCIIVMAGFYKNIKHPLDSKLK